MKQELTIQGRVELTHKEVAEAVIDFVSKEEKKLTKAIDAWLATKHNLQSTRVRYSGTGSDIQVVVDVKQKMGEPGTVIKFSDDPKEKRDSKGGFQRRNVGIFKYIQEYFGDEKKKGKKELSFDDVFSMVKFAFPTMDEQRLAVYLHDKRMLPNVNFSKKDNRVQIKG